MPENYKFYTEIKVRYEETDAMSIVYYGKYFVFFEVARTEYLKNIGYNYSDIEKDGFYFVVAEANCKYISPAKYDDDLRIYAKVDYIKNSSFNFSYNIVKIIRNSKDSAEFEEDMVKGSTVLVCVNNEDFKPRRMPDNLRAAMLAFESS